MGFHELSYIGFLVCCLLCCFSGVLVAVVSSPTVPAYFVFGDSLVDVGNNNYLPRSLATAGKLPNGIDFPTVNASNPTGRFTNGLNIVDIMALEFGMQSFAPPALAPTTKGSAILNGVNYASGGAGILNDTGRAFVQCLSMDKQISYFEQTALELTQMLGVNEAQNLLARAVVSTTIGANDFIENYLSPIPITSEQSIPPEQFIQKLIHQFKTQLERIYDVGARKLVVTNVPIIGCTPNSRSVNRQSIGNCSLKENELASAFNGALNSLLEELNNDLPGATFLYADAYGITEKIINNYQSYGFENAETACCGLLGSKNGIVPCRFPFVPMCSDRSKYLFWDPFHLTENGYEIIANEFMQGSEFISPMNIQQLVLLH